MREVPYPLCLVGGTGRSGTTLLAGIVGAHPDVASLPGEARFLTDPDGIVDFYTAMSTSWSPYAFDAKVVRLERLLGELGSRRSTMRWTPPRAAISQPAPGAGWKRLGRRALRSVASSSTLTLVLPRYWNIDLVAACPEYKRLVQQLLEELVEFRYSGRWIGMSPRLRTDIRYGSDAVMEPLRRFCRAFVECACQRQGATHLVEDTPFSLLAFGTIQELLPESRLVHIFRDPRDTVASYMEQRWSPSDPILAARFYAGIMRRWESIRNDLPEGSYLEISLHALIRDPEATLRKVCTFWGLSWHRGLLSADLSRSHSGRWMQDIPRRARAQVDEILAPFLEQYAD